MIDPRSRAWSRREFLLGTRNAVAGAAALGLVSHVPSIGHAAGKQHMSAPIGLYYGEALGRYGFPAGHPLGVDRQGAFWREALVRGLDRRVQTQTPRVASREEILRFHTEAHVQRVAQAQAEGLEFLDNGDTPVFPGVYEAAATVVGSALDGLERIVSGRCRRTFQAIGGLHHARREGSAGFCVFNDLGVAIETLRSQYSIQRVAYIDIDVHHGDGVFYAYERDPDLILADVHEDGRYLYPGTGRADETGKGKATGTKLNIPLPPGSGDREFLEAWPRVVAHLREFKPQFFLFQAGADGLEGDPLAHLRYSAQVHAHAARSLSHLADQFADGRIAAFGGGGYNRDNLGKAWCEVVRAFLDS
jgi:acetoin utilization protein AcuC